MKFIVLLLSTLLLPIFSFEPIKPRLCINCKHFKKTLFDDNKYGKCDLFPREIKNVDYLVDGSSNKPRMDYYYCSTARDSKDLCGRKGLFFVKKKGL
jgi:hypothetical protein